MKRELDKQYAPSAIEDKWYGYWEEKGYFTPKREAGKKPYTIVIPPPNITGQLHMGHALDNTLQDILIRYKRMSGFSTLWLPCLNQRDLRHLLATRVASLLTLQATRRLYSIYSKL